MHTAFKRELDKIDSLQYPAFTAGEIDYFLNRAIIKFVKTRYSGVNIKQQSFEQTQKRIEDIRTLVREVTVPCDTTDATKPNGYTLVDGFSNTVFDDDQYWLSLGEEVLINITSSDTDKRQRVTEITANEYAVIIDNPFSEHILHYNSAKPLRLFYTNTIEFISDGQYTIDEAYIRYIKKPEAVALSTTTDCELADITHDEIVLLATQIALENIEQPRYQSYTNEVMTME